MQMVSSKIALCVPGNHDIKLIRKLKGKQVQVAHGMQESLDQLAEESSEFIKQMIAFIDEMVSHYVLDEGNLVVAHAGMKEFFQGRGSKVVRAFALYGETTGESDEFGLPVRYPWANDYRGSAMVVYGHTPVSESLWINNTIDIDNGCVFGGKLTALRYPEKELVSIQAQRVYSQPSKPLIPTSLQRKRADILDIEDVTGKRIITTKLLNAVTIREENAVVALEVMSRFAIDPKWLIYLPPTMSPTETSQEKDLLEHPNNALHYYQKQGVKTVICEEKHMGSRAIIVLCQAPEVAAQRFGESENRIGVCYTRTGRSFFDDPSMEEQFIQRLNTAMTRADLWSALDTQWICLDCEIMPWSVKAQSLIRQQYAAVGTAATVSLKQTLTILDQEKEPQLVALRQNFLARLQCVERYRREYQRYCWPVQSLDDYQVAPFHVLATEGHVHMTKHHGWHLEIIQRLREGDPSLIKNTPHRLVEVDNPHSCQDAVDWWLDLTQKGGEGMVVKPFEFIAKGQRGLIQPAIKCRGSDYLRIIYGPEYTLPRHLERLKVRNLSRKRALALREFALGKEALDRFVAHESLYRYHEPVFGVLALESEPIDPRL